MFNLSWWWCFIKNHDFECSQDWLTIPKNIDREKSMWADSSPQINCLVDTFLECAVFVLSGCDWILDPDFGQISFLACVHPRARSADIGVTKSKITTVSCHYVCTHHRSWCSISCKLNQPHTKEAGLMQCSRAQWAYRLVSISYKYHAQKIGSSPKSQRFFHRFVKQQKW